MQTSTVTMKWGLSVVVLCCYSLAVIKAKSTGSLGNKSHVLVDDYVKRNQRQYADNILAMEAELDAFKLNYETQLQIMELQSKLLEDNMQEVNKNLQMFSPMSDLIGDCVHKYDNELATVYSVKSDIAGCVASTNRIFNNIVTSANTTIASLEFWYKGNLSSEIDQCYSNNYTSSQDMAICITSTIATADSVTDSHQKAFNFQMKAMNCENGNELLDCIYTIFYKTVSRIGVVTQKIENCSQGNELTHKSNSCEFTSLWNGSSLTFFGNKTLKSPFNPSKPVPCLLLKFES